MDKRSSKEKEYDFAVTAFRVVQETTEDSEEIQASPDQTTLQETPGKNPNAVALGRLGGKARTAKLTPEQWTEIARRAATKRWESRT